MGNQFDDAPYREILEKCNPEDFDGHTEFERLTPLERLRWLSNTVYFVYCAAKNNPDLGCNEFFDSKKRINDI